MTTLAALITTLETSGALTNKPVKDIKTAIKHLATALGADSPETCPVDVAWAQEVTWAAKLDAYFTALAAQGRRLSAANRRNVRHNLRTLFRAADAHGFLVAPVPPRLLKRGGRRAFERQFSQAAPYKSTYRGKAIERRYCLAKEEWPADIQAGWALWWEKRGQSLRPATQVAYEKDVQRYCGFIALKLGRVPTWDDLFDVGCVRKFLDWHKTRVGRKSISAHGWLQVQHLAAMANVLGRPEAGALAALRQSNPVPTPTHLKDLHMVTLAELEAVAQACLAAGRVPYLPTRSAYPGAQRAGRFQQGVMLGLLVRVPIRQRNLREMRLGHNIYQDGNGDWQLRFQGDELKIGQRGSTPNVYALNLSRYYPDWVAVWEEFLRDYRPRLRGAETEPWCFLTRVGRAFLPEVLGSELKITVAMHTGGKRFYPHLIRTIWATEHLADGGTFTTAAVMLGDTVPTVIKAYHHIIEEQEHAKASAFLAKKLRRE